MDISIFGYKLNLEILILIGVIYLILVGHTLCGCSNYSLMEGLDVMNKVAGEVVNNVSTDMSGNQDIPVPGAGIVSGNAKDGASKVNGASAGKEGFVGANTNYGQSTPYDLAGDSMIDTSSWSAPNMTVIPGQPLNPAVKQFLDRKQQQLPLPEGEMVFFANSEFKPECCPNTYSNSQGCACMTSQDYNYLVTRGGNNVPYSEY
jgi:hypothetical protein